MKRNDFKIIIKICSFWKIDKRKGNYKLPNGETLRNYLFKLINELLIKNNWAISNNGNIYEVINELIYIPFGENEALGNQEERIKELIREMI